MKDESEPNPVHILLVEDEALLRELVAESLQESGYEVLAVGDGEAGVDALESGAPIDVLVSDIRLPGLSGYELATVGRALRPEMKLILMTGYAPSLPTDLAHAVFRVLQKPFAIGTLAETVAASLGGGTTAPA